MIERGKDPTFRKERLFLTLAVIGVLLYFAYHQLSESYSIQDLEEFVTEIQEESLNKKTVQRKKLNPRKLSKRINPIWVKFIM